MQFQNFNLCMCIKLIAELIANANRKLVETSERILICTKLAQSVPKLNEIGSLDFFTAYKKSSTVVWEYEF